MVKDDKAQYYDSFAWLIYKQTEEWLNIHEDDYNAWVQEKNKKESEDAENELRGSPCTP